MKKPEKCITVSTKIIIIIIDNIFIMSISTFINILIIDIIIIIDNKKCFLSSILESFLKNPVMITS